MLCATLSRIARLAESSSQFNALTYGRNRSSLRKHVALALNKV
jgi:hypothetical protein